VSCPHLIALAVSLDDSVLGFIGFFFSVVLGKAYWENGWRLALFTGVG
jgi:hypothetical protein